MSIKWILTKTTGYQEIFFNNYMFVINIGVWVCQYNEGRLLSNKKKQMQNGTHKLYFKTPCDLW